MEGLIFSRDMLDTIEGTSDASEQHESYRKLDLSQPVLLGLHELLGSSAGSASCRPVASSQPRLTVKLDKSLPCAVGALFNSFYRCRKAMW